MFKAMGDYVALAAYQYMPMLSFAIVGILGIQGAAGGTMRTAEVSAGNQRSKGAKNIGRGAKAIATKGKSEGVGVELGLV